MNDQRGNKHHETPTPQCARRWRLDHWPRRRGCARRQCSNQCRQYVEYLLGDQLVLDYQPRKHVQQWVLGIVGNDPVEQRTQFVVIGFDQELPEHGIEVWFWCQQR
jgi:hypothetical protein